MKKMLTILCLLLLTEVAAIAAIAPVRISVTTTPNTGSGAQLTIDLLNANGTALGTPVSIDKGATVKTDAGGVLSFVMSEAAWTGATYNANYLVRVTYGGVVLRIDRLQVISEVQGLFGALINPAEIDCGGSSKDGYFLKNYANNPTWTPQAVNDFAVTAIDVSTGGTIDLSGYSAYDLVVFYGTPAADVTIDPDPANGKMPTPVSAGYMIIVSNRTTSGNQIVIAPSYIPNDASRAADSKTSHMFLYCGATDGWVVIGGNH